MARDMFHLLESMPTAATLIHARHRLEGVRRKGSHYEGFARQSQVSS